MFEPCTIVLYVDDLSITSPFYKNLLGINPTEHSPAFHTFPLSKGMQIGLKVKNTAIPAATENNGSGELAFTVDNNNSVDELFDKWQEKSINMALAPTMVPYGYTFVALDPDGNRLRVVSPGKN